MLMLWCACSGPSKPVDEPTVVVGPDARTLTAAERALADHRDRLLDQPGVVDVRLDGDGLIVDLCAPEVPLDLTGVDVPVTPIAGDFHETARGESCGCSTGGAYAPPGTSYPADCNTCTCQGGQFLCTLLACRIEIVQRVYFTRNAAVLSKQARPLLDEIAAVLGEHPELRVTVRGHADAKEISVDKLSKKRARAVRDYLIAAGVAKAQLLPIEAVGDDAPTGGGADADRFVEFVIAD